MAYSRYVPVGGAGGGGGGSGTVTQVNTGTGLTGGPITTSGTVSLADTAVTPGIYGDATHVAVINVDQQGRLIGAASQAISFPASGTVTSVSQTVPAFLSIAGSPVTTSGTLAIGLSGAALPVANGGTGQTTYTNGQLLIGNTTGNTLTKATLTAGSGVTITNSTGSITIAATGASPTVTAVSSNITLAANTIYTVDTTAARSLALPTPTSGTLIWVKDVSGTANTNNITITRFASEQIEGLSASYLLSTNFGSINIVADGTNWWFI